MIKKDIAEDIYQDHGGFTRAEAEEYTNLILELLQDGIREDGSVTIAGFGKFHHKQKPIREVILPNGQKTVTKGGERIQFLPGNKLKARINARKDDESGAANSKG